MREIDIFGFENSDLIFVRLILFSLFFIVSYFTLKHSLKMDRNPLLVVCFSVSTLASYYIRPELLENFILIPYGFLGSFIIILIPFVLVFFFVQNFNSSSTRRFFYFLVGLFYFFIGYINMEGFIRDISWRDTESFAFFLVSCLALITIIFEKFLRKYFFLKTNNFK